MSSEHDHSSHDTTTAEVTSSGDFQTLMMMGPMHMYVYFDSATTFVFQSFHTNLTGDDGMFALGCILCGVYAILHMGIPFLKERYLKIVAKKSETDNGVVPMKVRIVLSAFYFFYTLSNFMIMMIMMTMNGYVLIALALGLTCGYVIFSASKTFEELAPNHEMCHS